MRRPAVFFDRDNTLIISDGYLGDPAGVRLIAGAADAVARVRQLGYATVVISNQSGVARGMFGEDAVHAVNSRLDEALAEQNAAAVIDRHEFCPFHPEGTVEQYAKESELRKPAPGMILQAAEKLALDLPRSWLIGDAPRDIAAGKAAGCHTILFQDPKLPVSPAASETPTVLPDHFVQSLKDAIDIIERAALASASRASESAQPTEPPAASPIATTRTPVDSLKLPTMHKASSASPGSRAVELQRMESLVEQMLQEMRKREPARVEHAFSISKMVAGVVQVLALAALALASKAENPQNTLLLAIMLQLFTIALLIMGRQR